MTNRYYYIILLALFFCNVNISCKKVNTYSRTVQARENYKILIEMKDGIPTLQKHYEDNEELDLVDSIHDDSMFTYKEKKLLAKGKWKIADNQRLIYEGWATFYNDREINKVQVSGYDTTNGVLFINQQKLYVNNELDTTNSYYYNVYDMKKDSSVLDIKTIYRKDRKRTSYLVIIDRGKRVDSIELNQGKNLFPKNYFHSPYKFEVQTYYLNENGNRTSTSMKINWAPSIDIKAYREESEKN